MSNKKSSENKTGKSSPAGFSMTNAMSGAGMSNLEEMMPQADPTAMLKTLFGLLFFAGVVTAVITFAFDHTEASGAIFNWFNSSILIGYTAIAAGVAKLAGDI